MTQFDPDYPQGSFLADDDGYSDHTSERPIVPSTPIGGRRKKRTRGKGCLPWLLVLALVAALVVGGYFGVSKGVGYLKDRLGGPEDYPGPGSGSVTFEVKKGETATDMARELKTLGVVKSVQAFIDVAAADPASQGIQAGFYELQKKMAAEDALAILVDSDNLLKNNVTIPEGLRVSEVVKLLAKKTGISRAEFERALKQPEQLGLPGYAKGNAEGYLFPATYDVGPKATATSILKQMVARWQQSAEDSELEAAASDLGYSPEELMIVASLVEAEARGDDMAKVARVIYNRLENPGTAGTIGKLEIDSTVAYALGRNPGVALTVEELSFDSPYNTRLYKGLPPGPIDSPGDAAIAAAAHPAEGDWYYWVTVNLRTGKTKFAETPEEFLTYKQEYLTYCETSDAC